MISLDNTGKSKGTRMKNIGVFEKNEMNSVNDKAKKPEALLTWTRQDRQCKNERKPFVLD